ncbi:NAD-dependent epimerase/dehydratase family protein [Roseivirga seohaensis]|nr:NAD-dependent epimerase/dehydratase family protein [Roseivirga seohaensis]
MSQPEKRMLVLGGSGFIGSHLVQVLKEHNAVSVFERRRIGAKEQAGVQYIYGDFEQEDLLRKSLVGIDTVIHLISTTVPKTADADPVFDLNSNLMNTIRLLKILPETRVRKLIYFSSGGTVYGEPKTALVKEDHSREPIGSYGIVKCAIEDYIRFYASKNYFEYLIIRPSNPYGPGQISYGLQGVIPIIFDAIINDKVFQLWGGGSQVRDYIYIADLIEAVQKLIDAACTGAYNVGSGQGHDVNQLVKAVEQQMGKALQTKVVETDHNAIERFVLSIDKIGKDTGWSPQTALEDGLRKYHQWLMQRLEESES